MKKRFFCLILALTFGMGAILGGCTIVQGGGEEHKHTFAEEWSRDGENHWHAATCEHKSERKDVSAHDYGDDDLCDVCGYQKPTPKPEPPKYETGDIVTDKETRAALNESLREQAIAGMSAAFEGEYTDNAEDAPRTVKFDGVATLSETEKGWDADIGLTQYSEQEAYYTLAYLRGESAYMGSGSWLSGEERDYGAKLEEYRNTDGISLTEIPLSGAETDSTEAVAGDLLPVLTKLAKNSLVYAEADIVKTEEGYEMTIGLFDVLDKMLGDVQRAFETLKGPSILFSNPGNASINTFLDQPTLKSMLETMLYGITANELTTLLSYALDEDTMSVLPEATADMGALDYIRACLNSPDLAKALVDAYAESAGSSLDFDFGDNGLGVLPMRIVWLILFQKDFDRDAIVASIQEMRTDLKGDLLRAALGEDAEGEIDVVLTASFDEDHAFVALDADITMDDVRGTVTMQSEEGEELTVDVAFDLAMKVSMQFSEEPLALSDLSDVNIGVSV